MLGTVVIRRLVSLPLIVVSVTFLTFIVGFLAPGDPILTMMGNQRDPVVYENLRHLYGLDLPWYEQYWRYLQGLLHGDLGLSYRFAQRPVTELMGSGVRVSLALGGVALGLSLLLGVPIGMFAAFHHNRWGERLTMVPMLALFAIPSFVLIPLLQWINYQFYQRGWPSLPAAGWGAPQYWVLPVAVLAAGNLGYISRLTRANVLDVLRRDYVRTARGKGLPEQLVRNTHVLRNALLPIVTLVGPAIAFLVTGAFVVESLFSIPGVGFLSVQAVQQRDYPVIQGTVVVLTLAVVLMNLVTDLAYAMLDPRGQVGRMTERQTLVIEAMTPRPADALPGALPARGAVSLRTLFWRRFASNALAVAGLVVMTGMILAAVFGPLLVEADPNKIDYAAINALPGGAHPLGTDNLGRDTLARLLYGLRVSLLVALYVELLDIVLGVPLGLAAGYLGGKVDFVITRIADVLFAFPGLLLAILVTAIFGAAVTDRFGGIGRLALVAGALSLVSWPLMTRLVRSQTLTIREQDYVMAAQSLGAERGRILRRHIVPQLIGLVVTTVTLNVSAVIINEAVLSLLGLGIQPPDSSIGKMISDAIPYLESNALQVVLPSAVLMAIVLAVSFLGDGLRDAFSPESES